MTRCPRCVGGQMFGTGEDASCLQCGFYLNPPPPEHLRALTDPRLPVMRRFGRRIKRDAEGETIRRGQLRMDMMMEAMRTLRPGKAQT